MDPIGLLTSTALSLIFLALVFRPLEMVFPARSGQRLLRPDWQLDLLFFLGQYLLWSGAVLWVLSYAAVWIEGAVPSTIRAFVASQPWWAQAVGVVLLSDLVIYWGHRLQHRVGFLWRFHAVHHSSEHLDWLAAHREHPLDSIYTVGLINLPAILLGVDVGTLAGLVAFRGIWAIYIHSNVRLPLGPLRYIVGSPQIHHWHHDRDRNAGNYANLSPLMDLLFGTYHCPDHGPDRFGLDESQPKGYVRMLVGPLRKRRAVREEAQGVDGTAA
jgi:sterol desaturase/sphingolipid hydroxylase (fatty acid hydroxylase superfamily)